jgi:cytochrome c553
VISWLLIIVKVLSNGVHLCTPFFLAAKERSMKVKKIIVVCMAGALVLFGGAVPAGDITAGKAISASCAGCHGAQGISSNPLWPNLAGQQAGYLVKQLTAFRDGSRTDPMMTLMAKPLTDTDIQNLAAWYNSL